MKLNVKIIDTLVVFSFNCFSNIDKTDDTEPVIHPWMKNGQQYNKKYLFCNLEIFVLLMLLEFPFVASVFMLLFVNCFVLLLLLLLLLLLSLLLSFNSHSFHLLQMEMNLKTWRLLYLTRWVPWDREWNSKFTKFLKSNVHWWLGHFKNTPKWRLKFLVFELTCLF